MTIGRLLTILARFESHVTAGHKAKRLPPLLVLSDDLRGFTLTRQLQTWPRGAAFIDRTFGVDVISQDPAFSHLLRLATCTPRQARTARLGGIHWPQNRLKYRIVSNTSGLIETTSAHRGLAIAKAAQLGMDAILVSTAFTSKSPSAKRPLGAIRLAKLQRTFPHARIYALGGINLKTASFLKRTRIYGVALVSYDEN